MDHSFDALRRSLEGSLERLGRIDFLQLHKTTPDVLRSGDLARAWEYAASLGITGIGASVSDLESAEPGDLRAAFIGSCNCRSMRRRRHSARPSTRPSARGIRVAVNRPFGMGRMLYENRELTKAGAFAFILRKRFEGVILSGTKSPEHLEENWHAFGEAMDQARGS